MSLQLTAHGACITNQGPIKTVNEDACLVDKIVSMVSLEQAIPFQLSPLKSLVVADGIGGHHGGEHASHYLVGTLAQCTDYSLNGLHNLLCQANHTLYEMAHSKKELQWMGTTVAGIAMTNQGLLAFNVGDARVYQMNGKSLQQITMDDTLEQLLKHVDPSELPPNLPVGTHVLIQSLGGSSEVQQLEPHFYPIERPSGRFLICTDGLSTVVPHSIIEEIINDNQEAVDCVNTLFVESMRTGGTDDVTVVVMDIAA